MPGIKGMGKGNQNRSKGGRIDLHLSLSGEPKKFFRQQAMQKLGRDPTPQEIVDICRAQTYDWWNGLKPEDEK